MMKNNTLKDAKILSRTMIVCGVILLLCIASLVIGLVHGMTNNEPDKIIEPLPAIAWDPLPIPNAKAAAEARDWTQTKNILRTEMTLPDALETRLNKADREIWRNVLTHIEAFKKERKDALLFSNLQLQPAQECHPPVSGFSLYQHAQLQIVLQLHRNILWRRGRLNMAETGIDMQLNAVSSQFESGYVRGGQSAVLDPIALMTHQCDFYGNVPKPDGKWNPGRLRYRFMKTGLTDAVLLQMKGQFEQWDAKMKKSERYQHLTTPNEALFVSLDDWFEELDSVIDAFRDYAAGIHTLEKSFAPPHAFIAYPCIGKNFRRLRVLSEMAAHVLPMIYHLDRAYFGAAQVAARLKSQDYAAVQQDYLLDEVGKFQRQVGDNVVSLLQLFDAVLFLLDETNDKIWEAPNHFVDPIHHYMQPAVEDGQIWNAMFNEMMAELNDIRRQIDPEPMQPLNKRGKPYPPYIDDVIDMLHAPARIDEVEHGLLAISELEAHMLSVRNELMRRCKMGACRSFPEAEIANSPRDSAWVVSWRQSPANERTLGHSLIVLKRSQLHLSRLVQRLSDIYAWLSETTNVVLTWQPLKSWQRIWTLYAEPNGTYASFLRSVATLDQNISDLTRPPKNRAVSPNLQRLLILQDRFFDLTLDYARFVDSKRPAPVSFDELSDAWANIDETLLEIQAATHRRDDALAPPGDTPIKPKQPVRDIPR